MGRLARMTRIAAALIVAAAAARAEAPMIEDFTAAPETRWSYLSDQVMGGVSEGRARFGDEDGRAYVRLTGAVSTENRGGFVQVRRPVDPGFPAEAEGLVLTVRGNGERYFVHLRTTGTLLPWQYYQAPFDTGPAWAEVRIPFAAFKPSGGLLRRALRPESVRSIGIVAYGRDHAADVSVAQIGLY